MPEERDSYIPTSRAAYPEPGRVSLAPDFLAAFNTAMTDEAPPEILPPAVRPTHRPNGQFAPGYDRRAWAPSPGRPVVLGEVRRLCRENSLDAIKVLLEIMNNPDKPEPARIVAAREVLNRAWGSSDKETKIISHGNDDWANMPTVDLEARVEMLLDETLGAARVTLIRAEAKTAGLDENETLKKLLAAAREEMDNGSDQQN